MEDERLITCNKYCGDCRQHLEAIKQIFRKAPSDTATPELELVGVSLQDIEKAAAQGCHLCSLKYYNWWISRNFWEKLPFLATDVDNSEHSVLKDSPTVLRIPIEDASWKGPTQIRYYCRSAKDHALEKFATLNARRLPYTGGTRESVPRSTFSGSDLYMKLATTWLRECLDYHPDCQRKRLLCGDGVQPSRLLDVSQSIIKLRDQSSLDRQVEYIALSHCWGQAVSLCLTTQSLARFREGLRFTDLPILFQDAITVTRSLSCKFLWIDSLCILQDVKDDWAKELVSMGDIFLGARCTIAAVTASDANCRLFEARNPLCYTDCFYASDEVDEEIWLSHPAEPTILETWSGSGKDARPLLCRGWVVQEKYLSGRILAFGNGTINWSCTSDSASENFPRFDKRTSHLSADKMDGFDRYLVNAVDDSRIGSSGFLYSWHRLVEEYSRCVLTFPTDRLPAITGLINVIARRTGKENCCGIWCPHVLEELLWRVKGEPQEQIRNNQPTWSWTSLVGPVEWLDEQEFPGPYLIEAEFISITRPVARLQNRAEICIRARLQRVCAENPIYKTVLDYSTLLSQDAWMLLIGFEDMDHVCADMSGHEAMGLLVEPVLGSNSRWRRIGHFTDSSCFQPISGKRLDLHLVYLV